MLNFFIKKYTENITKNDIINFSKKEGINLTNSELEIIYNQIKYNTDNILLDSDKELLKIKDKLDSTTYLKIKQLIKFYKEKYKDYL